MEINICALFSMKFYVFLLFYTLLYSKVVHLNFLALSILSIPSAMTKKTLESNLSALQRIEATTARSQIAELYDQIINLAHKGVTLKAIHETINDNGINIKISNFYAYIKQEGARRLKINSQISNNKFSQQKDHNVLKSKTTPKNEEKNRVIGQSSNIEDIRIKTFEHKPYNGEDII